MVPGTEFLPERSRLGIRGRNGIRAASPLRGCSVQRIDLEPVLEGETYGPLRDLELFRSVRIDPEAHTLVCGADFDPATLHDWPRSDALDAGS